MENSIKEKQQHTTQKIQEQLDFILENMDNMTISTNSSDIIMNTLKNIPNDSEDNYFDQYPQISKQVRNYMFSLTALKSLKGRISIISKYYDFVDFSNRNDTQNITKENVRNFDFVREGLRTEKFRLILLPHSDVWSSQSGKVFSIVRPLRDTNYEIQGLIQVSYNIDSISKLFDSQQHSQILKGAILDQNQQSIFDNFDFSRNRNWIVMDKLPYPDYGNYEVEDPETGQKYIVTFSKLSNTDWTILLLENLDIIEKPILIFRLITIASYLSLFVIFIVILYVFTKNVTMPIRNLKKAVTTVDMESLRIKVKTDQKNEITILTQAFQDLLDEVKDNMELMKESRSREMDAHMLALQAQMNPHFLYNTLAVIGAYGIKKENNEVMQMCADLSDMLRYSIHLDNGRTKIYEEITHIKKYLKLMSLRFENSFEYEIDIDNALMDIIIPKLTLEPLVENAFQHAFVDVEPPWVLRINGYIKNNRWFIKFEDNGNGFKQEAIEQLKYNLNEDNYLIQQDTSKLKDARNIGLYNTFIRLRLLYKGQETIDFFNSKQNGAILIIGGPIVQVR